eukprot:5589887-Amphidinium_carterae.1
MSLPSSASVEFDSLTRIQRSYRFLSDDDQRTVMFHGCRTAANEASILRESFQVARCNANGPGFGTWLAYNAKYSHKNGCVYQDPAGLGNAYTMELESPTVNTPSVMSHRDETDMTSL